MKTIFSLLFLCLVLTLPGCGASNESTPGNSAKAPTPQIPVAADSLHDLTTPEGAILSLEDAYRSQDLEAAVRCKDFAIEAKLMLEKLSGELKDDPEILAQTTEVLELGFRSQMKNDGFPDFRGIESTFSVPKPYQDREDMVELTETCRHADGKTTQNQMVVAKTEAGWKVLSVVD